MAELRLDLLGGDVDPQNDLRQLLSGSSLPLIVSCIPISLGGAFEGDEAQRTSLLRAAAQQGVRYVDIDLDAAHSFFADENQLPDGIDVIVSHYSADCTPDDDQLRQLAQRLQGAGGSIARVVTAATDVTDSLRLLALLREHADSKVPMAVLAAGFHGLPTRVLAPKYGGCMTFGAVEKKELDDVSVAQLIEEYRLRNQTAETKILGIVGTNVVQDKNYIAHNAAYEAVGLKAVYLAYMTENFAQFLEAARQHQFAGFSVTMPFKGLALAAADEKDDVAKDIGAANTMVWRPQGGYKALNTDWVGVKIAIEKSLGSGDDGAPLSLAGKKALVVGTGGAGQAVAYYAAQAGAQVLVSDMLADKAQQVADSLGRGTVVVSMDDVNAGRLEVDILANASPIGMNPKPDDMALTTEAMSKSKLVFDCICSPPVTKLLKTAEKMGITTGSGFDMLVGQAAYQFKLFTGLEDDVTDVMRDAVLPTL